MARPTPRMGKVQLQIMQVLWGRGEATAREILAALHREAMSEYVSAVSLAQVYVGLGEPSAALDQLERALADRAA